MKSVSLGTKTLRGEEVEVFALAHGNWRIEKDGRRVGEGATLEKAEANAGAALAKARIKVSVPFYTQQGEKGVATGFNLRTNAILARVNDEAGQINSYKAMLKPDTPKAKLDRLAEINIETRNMERERRLIEQEFGFDLRRAVEDAIREAQEAKAEATS